MHHAHELEALLLRIVPGLARDWSGASPDEIEELEERVEVRGYDFPPFYRWFLSRSGGSVGALDPVLRGFTSASVLEAYRSGSVDLGPTQFLIGRVPDALYPRDVYYDLAHPRGDDALVLWPLMQVGPGRRASETFREFIAAGAMLKFRVMTAPHRCAGRLVNAEGNVAALLETMMRKLGFSSPLATGFHCRLYEREGVTMVAESNAGPENLGALDFQVGGPDAADLRRLLRGISIGTSLQVDADRWASLPG